MVSTTSDYSSSLTVNVQFDDDLPNGPYVMPSRVAPGGFDVFVPSHGAKFSDVKQAMENFAVKNLITQPEIPYSKVTVEWTLEEISYKGGAVPFDSEAKEGTYQAAANQQTKIKQSRCLLCAVV